MKHKLDLLIVSDLHAHVGDPNNSSSPSFLSSNSIYQNLNPLRPIPELLKKEGLSVDWIVSPGDLGDRADPVAQRFAWDELARLKQECIADLLIGTAGNHDLDSRRTFPEVDLKGSLQLLRPAFPIDKDCYQKDDLVYQDRFWSRNFSVVHFPEYDCTLVILNSCAFHGYSSDSSSPAEHTRGKLSQLTCDAIIQAVEGLKTKLNILLVHHHPIKLPFVPDGNSIMIGGSELIAKLKSTQRQWLILHGHQHVPHLSYSDAEVFAPVVLSAGSVAARTFPIVGTHPRNQIHHVSVDLSLMDSSGLDLFGTVTTWSWINTRGWQQAQSDAGIPYRTGFGYRFEVKQILDDILSMAKAIDLLDWKCVLTKYPKLRFAIPEHLTSLLAMVEKASVRLERDEFGMPLRMEYRR